MLSVLRHIVSLLVNDVKRDHFQSLALTKPKMPRVIFFVHYLILCLKTESADVKMC